MRSTRKNVFRRSLCAALAALMLLALTGCAVQREQVSELSQLSGGRLVSAMGVIDSDAAARDTRFENVTVDYALMHENALAQLLSGKADAMATDYITAKITAASTPGVKILGEKFDMSDYVFALPKESRLLPELNSMISDMKNDGSMESLIDIWTGSVESRKIIPTATWDGSAGTIRCSISPDAKALCYTDGLGSLAGAEVNLIYLLAERMNCKVTFSVCDRNALFTSVAAGDCDIAFGGIRASDLQRGDIGMSDAYLEGGTVFLVRDIASASTLAEKITTGFYRFFMENNRWRDLLSAVGTTLVLTLCSAAFSVILGGLLFLWQYSGSRVGNAVIWFFRKLFTFLPTLTWLLIVYYGIFAFGRPSNMIVAITAFSMFYSFDVLGVLSGGFASIPAGQKEAAAAMGYGKYTALRKIYLPQMLPSFLGGMEGLIVLDVKLCSLSEFIFVSDFQAVSDAIRAQTFDPFFPIAFAAVFYVLLGLGLSRLVHLLAGKITARLKKDETVIRREIAKGGTR